MKIFSCALVALAATAAVANPEHHAPPLDPALETALARVSGETIAAYVQQLASDEFQGRMPGTEGERLTTELIAQVYAEAGLKPAVNGSYYQEVPLLGALTRGTPTMTIRGPDGAFEWRNKQHWVAGVGVDEPELRIEDSEIVFAGYGIHDPATGWDDYGDIDLTGKTVIYFYGDPGQATGDPALFKGRAMSHPGTRAPKARSAGQRGAVATFWIHVEEGIGYPWSVYGDAPHKWAYRIADDDSIGALKLQGTMPIDAVRELVAKAGMNFDEMAERATRRDFQAVPLGLKADIAIDSEVKVIRSRNVLGLLPGSERPDEVVIYTAHWDHDGMNPDADGDGIFNGAVDNATGTAVLMHLAQRFGALPERPARSVLFFATTAEERGLLGAQYYVHNPLFPMHQTVAVINMDALFPFGRTKGMTVTALGSSEVEDYLAGAAAREGRRLYDDGNPQVGAYYRSDHFPFAEAGVPAIFAVGGPAMEDGVEETVDIQRWVDYGQNRYHKPADEYDAETWDMAGIVQDAKMFMETGYRIADDTRWPNWYLGNEFRALRDRQLAEGREAPARGAESAP